jgi:hypothetical protein
MKLVTILSASTLFALAGLVACGDTTTVVQQPPGGATSSSGGATSSGGENTSGGLQGDGVGNPSSAPDTNAAGDPYPTTGLGTKTGAIIRNYKFLGYPDADVADGLKAISLAQFYDPTGEKYQMIHIQAAGVWCQACKGETTALVPIADELVKRKVVWIVSLAEGPTPGTPSKQPDLDGWISEFSSPFTHVLDPSNKNLGPFYDRSALPWNANIDATTMKILTSGTGGAQSGDAILEEIDDALAMIKK